MRTILLNCPAGQPADPARLARLTRHLRARLLDFGPGGPEVLSADEGTGVVAARFPGREAGQVLERLEREYGIRAALEGDKAVFYLRSDARFEDLDRVWGGLADILS